jgi:hypothetical protein
MKFSPYRVEIKHRFKGLSGQRTPVVSCLRVVKDQQDDNIRIRIIPYMRIGLPVASGVTGLVIEIGASPCATVLEH